MKKIIGFSILFIGLFFGVFNSAQAEIRTMTIPLEIGQKDKPLGLFITKTHVDPASAGSH
ncbi:hypothetical protein KKF60_01265 [Patescibacteria group bacterium]|nr:hypothetical protein [Patescibacteria group bacterium]MBU4458514.1 hypothetical protein [Patescibacteria group bacterium]MCG2696382.1 hypothetical protein [Candidatus Portnoybacteria bacterium]